MHLATEGTTMQLATLSARVDTPPQAPTTQHRGGEFARLERGIFTKKVDLNFGEFASNHAALDDAIAAAKQLSAGDKPAAVVAENLFTDQGSREVPTEQKFSVYSVEFNQWRSSRGGQLETTGPYHHGALSRTKGYQIDDMKHNDPADRSAIILVDDGTTWDNGIEPRS